MRILSGIHSSGILHVGNYFWDDSPDQMREMTKNEGMKKSSIISSFEHSSFLRASLFVIRHLNSVPRRSG